MAATSLVALGTHADGQVYRCGSSYSHTPCAGGKEVDVSPPLHWKEEKGATQSLYLCQAFGGGRFWTTEPCAQRDALVERIEAVPRGMPFEQQVELARQRVNEAQRAAAPQQDAPRRPNTGPGSNVAFQCRSLDERVKQLDAMARAGGGPQHMDWIAHERKTARDKQFRLRC